jgi:multicomponent Na+:H+ antiporter subunit D
MLLVLSVVVPLVCAAICTWPATTRLARLLTPWAAVAGFIAAVAVPVGTTWNSDSLLLGVDLQFDGTAQVFLLFTSLLWLFAGVYASAYMSNDPRQTSFFGYFALAQAGNMGLIVAADVVTFYAAFTVMSLASYGLVAHNRDERSRFAARVYMVFAVAGELAVFAGLVGMVVSADALRFDELARQMPSWAMACAIAGFAVKVGVLGAHMWLPLAHPAAPVPASAVLSGAMIKAGLLGWLRVLPTGSPGFETWGWTLFGLGLTAAFFAAVVGVTQRDPKAVLAYSSVSQMGLMTSGVGFGLAAPAWSDAAVGAVLLYAAHHALAKSALFLGVGVASRIERRRRTLVTVGLALPALSLAGAPLTSGALAKSLLKAPVLESAPIGGALVVLLSAAAVGTTLLMLRFLTLLPQHNHAEERLDRRLSVPWLSLVLLGPVLAFAPWPAVGTTQVDLLTAPKLTIALAPIAIGLLIAAAAPHVYRRWPGLVVQIPAGDVLAYATATVGDRKEPLRALQMPPRASVSLSTRSGERILQAIESSLHTGPVIGVFWLGLVLVLVLVGLYNR